jgi:nitrate/nitrite-specific signal transduction histidine kinase
MLAQQMDAAGHRVVAGRASEREVLSQAVAECDRILDALERGGRALEREVPAAEGAVREELHLVRRQWVEVKPALLALASRSGDDPETHAAFARVEPLVASLPRAAHRVVLAIEEHGRVLRRRMLYTLAAVALFDLVVLLVGLWLTERYLTRPVRLLEERVRRVERGDLGLPVPIVTRDELATVAVAFNEMSDTLARLREERGRK